VTGTQNILRQDDVVQTAAKTLFLGCAPEREDELNQLWSLLAPKFQMTGDIHDGDRIILDAGAYRYVRFNHRALRAFWIGAFAAWEGYRAVAESVDIANVSLSRLSSLLDAFEKMVTSDQSDTEPLPEGVPEPGAFADASTDGQARAAAELATMAIGWALLHEVRHIKHQQEGTGADPDGKAPEPFHKEEFACDEFATKFLLEKIEDYATSQAVEPEKVRRKRQLAIYIALFAITLLAKDHWSASLSHPAVQDRINAITTLIGADRSELAEAIAHTSFAALRALWPTAPGVAVAHPIEV
jgi:hypothetical protein